MPRCAKATHAMRKHELVGPIASTHVHAFDNGKILEFIHVIDNNMLVKQMIHVYTAVRLSRPPTENYFKIL